MFLLPPFRLLFALILFCPMAVSVLPAPFSRNRAGAIRFMKLLNSLVVGQDQLSMAPPHLLTLSVGVIFLRCQGEQLYEFFHQPLFSLDSPKAEQQSTVTSSLHGFEIQVPLPRNLQCFWQQDFPESPCFLFESHCAK